MCVCACVFVYDLILHVLYIDDLHTVLRLL